LSQPEPAVATMLPASTTNFIWLINEKCSPLQPKAYVFKHNHSYHTVQDTVNCFHRDSTSKYKNKIKAQKTTLTLRTL